MHYFKQIYTHYMKPLQDSQTTSYQYGIDKNLISCSQGFEAFKICSNYQCSKSAFMCLQQDCKCYQNHQRCMKVLKQSFETSLKNKLVTFKQIEDKIKTSIQNYIDLLSKIEEDLLKQLREKQSQLIGLNQYQKIILSQLAEGSNQLKGTYVYTALRSLQKPIQIIQITVNLNEDIDNHLIQLQNYIEKFEQKMKFTIKKFGLNYFKNSKVVRNTKQEKIIEQFFNSQSQKIKNVELIFRASDNQYSAQKFHKLCDGKTNTITICQNIFDKKFGGFTPLPWQSSDCECFMDQTGKSFVFSLTNNDKFIDQTKQNSLICHKQYGPVFGNDNADIAIGDKCNKDLSSYCSPNQLYKNQNYVQGSKQSQFLMTAVKEGGFFLVKEYEVWKVNFY